MTKRDKENKKGGPEATGGSGGGPHGALEGGSWDLAFPRWVPAVVYAAATLLLFRKFVFSGDMLLGQDTLSLGFVARNFFAQALRSGTFPLWNPLILGGTPFLDSLAGGDSLYPTSILLLVMAPFRALGWKLVLHVFLAGLFTYGWIRALDRSRVSALLCGLAYVLAPFMVTLVYPGHDGKLFVTALTPLLFWATESSLTGGRLRDFALIGVVVALVILTTHFQQAYFLFGAVGVYAFIRSILLWKGSLPGRAAGARFGFFLAFSVLGAGVSAVQLVPAVEYVTEFSRRTATTTQASAEGSVAYSSSWSLHPEEVAAMVVPEFAGSSVGGAAWATGTYWGRNPFKLNSEYGGLVVLLLACLAFFGAPSRGVRYAVLGLGSVALLYALGGHTPVWRMFYELVPGVSLFRAPSIAAFLFGFGAVTLMAFGIDRILALGGGGAGEPSQPEKGKISGDRSLLRFLVVVSGLLLLGAVLASAGTLTTVWVSVLYPSLDPGKADALARAQPFIARGLAFAFVLAAGVTLLAWLGLKRKLPLWAWTLAVGVLVSVDLARVDDPFIQTMDFQSWSAPDPNARFLQGRLETEDPFRVLAMGGQFGFGQDVKPAMYGLELAAGHHPNDMARYRELIGMVGSGAPANLFDAVTGAPKPSLRPLLSILNVRYILWPNYRAGALPVGEPVSGSTLDGRTTFEAVYEVPTLPRARLVGEAVVVADDEAVPYILSEAFRPEIEVVLTEPPPVELPGGVVEGEVQWLERGPNAHRLRVLVDGPALLVEADNWYPAWKARVDGAEAPVLRANHTLRAVPVGAGDHEVEIYYDAGSLRGSMLVSLFSLLVLAGAVVKGGGVVPGGRAVTGQRP